MRIRIRPSVLWGTIGAIASKSDVHRLLICAALADRPTAIAIGGSSRDIEATIGCLRALGAEIAIKGDRVTVSPVRDTGPALLSCGESGSTLRFLLPVAAALGRETSFEGEGRLPERPLSELTEAMASHGVSLTADRLPLTLRGRLTGGEYTLPGNISSQYITGLLLALPLASESSRIRLTTALESGAYVQMTLRALRRFNVEVSETEDGYAVAGGQRYTSPAELTAEGDWSNAAFFLCAGALGRETAVSGLDITSPQGDKAILELLGRFGAGVRIEGGTAAVSPAKLRGCGIDVRDVPDLLPVLAAVAAHAEGETRLTGAARLRLKESDRLTATAAMLRALGAEVRELPDGLVIQGGGIRGGCVDSFGDHRIAMAGAIAAIGCAEDVIIDGAESVEKSYPDFFEDYRRLGGAADVI